ncbi:7024_t:CDS:1 [Acaulospora colombiana]|uniref:7024_t:CDS:1 n=1 Tax=Acaulospora colombiana TaxID=27376 RepID=A0ACA9NXQ6_9GLOM|nr:7024_t:CDS:1 [Acaulospora colombiana]
MSESNRVILFEQERAFYLHRTRDSDEIGRYLDDPNVWHIVDGKKPDKVDAKTILICSPLKDHYKDFYKSIPSIRYMPVWSWNEIDTCRNKIFGSLSRDKVRELFMRWGGIPRYVLESALKKEIQDQLEDAFEVCNEDIFRYIGGRESERNISYKLIHIWSNLPTEEDDAEGDEGAESGEDTKPYMLKTIIFASDYVGEQVAKKLRETITDKLCKDMDAVLEGGKSDSILGSFFETIVHRMLRGGGTFQVRSLDSNETYNLTLCQQDKILKFSEIDNIENEKYYQPIDKTFPSIDAIFSPKYLFQMTTAINNSINTIGLKKLHGKLAKTGYIDFYFVVPAQLYDKYQKQNYVTTKNVIDQNVPLWIRKRVRQHVLRIDLSSGSLSSKNESSLKRSSSSSREASASKRVKK